MLSNILSEYTYNQPDKIDIEIYKLMDFIKRGYLEDFFTIVKSLFASIPQNIAFKKKEEYYFSIYYMIMTLLGVHIKNEVKTDRDKIITSIETIDKIYIIEFKLGESTEVLNQIEDEKYSRKYSDKKKPITLVGVGFDFDYRNISGFEIRKLNSEEKFQDLHYIKKNFRKFIDKEDIISETKAEGLILKEDSPKDSASEEEEIVEAFEYPKEKSNDSSVEKKLIDEIFILTNHGFSPKEIASSLNRSVGEIELAIKLRRYYTKGESGEKIL